MVKRKNNGIFYVVISLVVVLAIAASVSAYALTNVINVNSGGVYNNYETTQDIPEELNLGAFPGPDIYSDVNIHGKLTTGGSTLVATSTMQVAFSLTAAQVCENSTIIVNSGCTADTVACGVAASLDVTLPATSTLWTQCLSEEGAETSFIFVNASPTAASTTELVAGTGCEGMISGDTGAADTIAGGAAAKITLKRVQDFWGESGTSDCIFLAEELIKD